MAHIIYIGTKFQPIELVPAEGESFVSPRAVLYNKASGEHFEAEMLDGEDGSKIPMWNTSNFSAGSYTLEVYDQNEGDDEPTMIEYIDGFARAINVAQTKKGGE